MNVCPVRPPPDRDHFHEAIIPNNQMVLKIDMIPIPGPAMTARNPQHQDTCEHVNFTYRFQAQPPLPDRPPTEYQKQV